MADFDPKMIEALARALYQDYFVDGWSYEEADKRGAIDGWRSMARAVLRALPLSPDALNALWRGEAVVVPKVPTGDMIEAHQSECAGDADEAGPARIRSAYAAMLAASPYARKDEP